MANIKFLKTYLSKMLQSGKGFFELLTDPNRFFLKKKEKKEALEIQLKNVLISAENVSAKLKNKGIHEVNKNF